MARISTYREYQTLALRTEKPLAPSERVQHAILGLITENGEFTTEIKRSVIYNQPWRPDRMEHLVEELGDVCWYLAVAFDAFGLEMRPNSVLTPRCWLDLTFNNKLVRASNFITQSTGSLIHTYENALVSSGALHSDDLVTAGLHKSELILKGMLNVIEHTAIAIVERSQNVDIGWNPMYFVLQTNVEKLKRRFPAAYTNEAAEARVDKNGLDARHS